MQQNRRPNRDYYIIIYIYICNKTDVQTEITTLSYIYICNKTDVQTEITTLSYMMQQILRRHIFF